jgi:hypothetical protein
VHPGRLLSNILSLDENIDSVRETQVVSTPQRELPQDKLKQLGVHKYQVDTLAQAGVLLG